MSRFRRLSHTPWHCQYHCGMSSEVSVSDPDRSGKAGSGGRDQGDLWVWGLRGGGAECADKLRANGCDEPPKGIDIGTAKLVEGPGIDGSVPKVSVFEEEAVLGQSLFCSGAIASTQ